MKIKNWNEYKLMNLNYSELSKQDLKLNLSFLIKECNYYKNKVKDMWNYFDADGSKASLMNKRNDDRQILQVIKEEIKLIRKYIRAYID